MLLSYISAVRLMLSISDRILARNEYDDDGRLVATVDVNGNRLEFSHDIEGKRDIVTDRHGNSTLYVYDNRGNVISETDALGNTTLSTYDNNGNLITRTDAFGAVCQGNTEKFIEFNIHSMIILFDFTY